MNNRSVYVAATCPYSGKSLISLGILQMVMRRTPNIGYFRPIIDDLDDGIKDNHIETMISYFNLNQSYEDAYAFTKSEIIDLQNSGRLNEAYDSIIQKYKALEDRFDFVLIDGTDISAGSTSLEYDLNVIIAKSLNIPVVLVVKDSFKNSHDLAKNISLELNNFLKKDNKVIAVIVNKCDKDIEEVITKSKKRIGDSVLLSIIPNDKPLSFPTLKEVADVLGAKVLHGSENLNRSITKFMIGGMLLSQFINYVEEDCVVILPGDRSDLIVGTLLSNLSNFKRISGIILTAGIGPDASIMKMIDGSSVNMPIMLVDMGTFEAATAIDNIKSTIYPENTAKIKRNIDLFEQYVDVPELDKRISSFKIEGITPRMFQYNLLKEAKAAHKHIVLPEGGDERILRAASMLADDEIVKITILGKPDEIIQKVNQLGLSWNTDLISVLDNTENDKLNNYVDTLYELRKDKGMEHAQAKDLMLDASYFGTMMVYKGDADGMVSGAQNTTAHTIRPALQFVKTKPGIKTVSSVFFMLLQDRVLVYGDCAIVPNPTYEQLADIAISAAGTAKEFGIEPKIAMLSYSSGYSGAGVDVDKVRKATELVKSLRPDLLIEGPIQYDAAVVPSVGSSKMPGSLVAGKANVLIFPDLNTGNNTYKAVQRESGGLALGPVLQGLRKPINDLSRGAKIEDIYNTVVITAIQAANDN
ncbi:phosphate acetyltransferase [Apibacter sp. B3889]|uniref:phosphate acetyltransferase n=1 Tax=unclassified Apibacter TaxID=2630820 RepID=UPI0013279164|nr:MULTISPECIES: phosphate acetyltransferase [unclassified Apibacter]MXO34535.1 phosphate acetyltransferase [Apibacter sp. B3883]MXO41334.1 phosphate acetyltransferase [Apibacter sp. B3889]MXP02904.1 phosphate acetyltransferase [Apibacter sp. B3887]MXP07833.1 phosphate acetyltransferase [Apibacter sp. B3935]